MALALALGALALGTETAAAQAPPPGTPEPPLRISTNAPLPLLVDGLETDKLPAAIGLGSEVCVVSAQHYTAESERWLFQRWSHGPTAECVTLTQPGVYRALYRREVLLHIRSSLSQLQKSVWVAYGAPVDFQVPANVQDGERTRYRFLQWSDGETPLLPANRIAPLKPMTLEAKFVREYLVGVEGPEGAPLPGSGWYPDGSGLALQAPDVLPGQAATDRLKFTRWETVGSPSLLIPDAEKPAVTVKVDGPYTIKAVYDREFLVDITNATGTLQRKWLASGEDIAVESPPTIETIPGQARLVFKRWEGLESVASPSLKGTVEGPLALRAVYERQVMVTVVTPGGTPSGGGEKAAAPQVALYGLAAGGGWQTVGATVTVSVPGSAQSKLVFNHRFVGFAGYAGGKSSIQVLVAEPITITALYRTEVNVPVLALLLLVPLAAVILYFANRWVLLLVRRRT